MAKTTAERIVDNAKEYGAILSRVSNNNGLPETVAIKFTIEQLEAFVQGMLDRWNEATKGSPNAVRVTSYDKDGKIMSTGSFGGPDARVTHDMFTSFWMYEDAGRRGVPLPPRKIGSLYVTTSESLVYSMFNNVVNIDACAKFLFEYSQAHGKTVFMDSDGARVLRNLKPT